MPARFRDFYLRNITRCFRVLFILQRITFLVLAYSLAEIQAFTAVALGCAGRIASLGSVIFCVTAVFVRWRRPERINVRGAPVRY